MIVIPSSIEIKNQSKINNRTGASSSKTKQQAAFEKMMQSPGQIIRVCGTTDSKLSYCIQYTVTDPYATFDNLVQTVRNNVPGGKKK